MNDFSRKILTKIALLRFLLAGVFFCLLAVEAVAQTDQAAISQQIKDHYQQGKQLSAEGKYEEAMAEFDKAKELGRLLEYARGINSNEPVQMPTQKQKQYASVGEIEDEEGEALSDLKRIDNKISDYTKELSLIKKNMEKAVKKLKELESNNGRMTDIQELKNYLNTLQADYAELFYEKNNAVAERNKLLKHQKQLVRLKAMAYYNKAIDYSLRRDTKKAIAMYEEAISVYPEDSDAHYNLALEYIRMSRYKEAASEYELVMQLEPDNAELNYNLAVLYDDYLDDNRKAIFYFKRYLSEASGVTEEEAEQIKKWIKELEVD